MYVPEMRQTIQRGSLPFSGAKVSDGQNYVRTSGVDVYLTSNKVRLQKYLIIKCSGKGHLLDL